MTMPRRMLLRPEPMAMGIVNTVTLWFTIHTKRTPRVPVISTTTTAQLVATAMLAVHATKKNHTRMRCLSEKEPPPA